MLKTALFVLLILIFVPLILMGFRTYTGKLFSELNCTAAGEDQELSNKALSLFQKMNLSGAFLISKQGSVLSKGYCGIADLKLHQHVTPDTQFNIGSLTKQFTGYLLHDLVGEGKISLDKPIRQYVPELAGSPLAMITVRQLMKMTSGLPDVLPMKYFIGTQLSSRIRSEDEFLSAVRELSLESKPGDRFNYSNVGYSLLGVLIGRIEQKSWADSLRQRIFLPFNMTHSLVEGVVPEKPKGLAVGFLSIDLGPHLGSVHLALPHWNYSMIKGAGGIVSTVDDLYLWNKALTARQIADPTWAKTYFPSGLPNEENYLYGWFWNKLTLPDGKKLAVLSHGGEDPGYCAVNVRLPGKGAYVIVTLNSDYCALKDGAIRPFLSFAAEALVSSH